MSESARPNESLVSKERVSETSKKWLKGALIAGGVTAAGLGIAHLAYGNIPAAIIHLKVGLKSLGIAFHNWIANVLPSAAHNAIATGQHIAANLGNEASAIPAAITRPV